MKLPVSNDASTSANSKAPKLKTSTSFTESDGKFPIIGIGASAGGLEALEEFFKNVPENSGMAFVIVQHLDPTRIGIMPELLQRDTKMKVTQVTDRIKVVPNNVYVIPPNRNMSMLIGALHLFEPIKSVKLKLPIDIFFRSLANDMGERSIGIILSGMGSDGSLGVKAIKEVGGIVIVQDPDSAKFDGMPRSAMRAVVADIVEKPDCLMSSLVKYLNFLPRVSSEIENSKKNTSDIEKLIILIRQKTGHDFSLYKKNTLFRRIERRKGVHQIHSIKNYVRFVQENPMELDILFKELLIGVTNFFRDPQVWDRLKENIIPDLIKSLPDGTVIRTWVPACSTGEEVYSLAIVISEEIEKVKGSKNITAQLFATDIDVDSIEFARQGYYSKNIVNDVSEQRLKRYFKGEKNGYKVLTFIREMIVFATQNVIKDPPFTKLHLLTCRNMLIYVEAELQRKIISLFNYSLLPDGILILGSAESIGNEESGFKVMDNRLKIFKNTNRLSAPSIINFPRFFNSKSTKASKDKIMPKSPENIQTSADLLILQQYSPSSIFVNENGDIIYITGRTGKYLEPAAGKANWNVFAMARDGLRQELPGAFRKAIASKKAVSIDGVRIGTNGGTQYANVIVEYINKPDILQGLLMVVITDVKEIITNVKMEPPGKQKSTGRIKELEVELQKSYRELERANEDMHTSQEELKSTNEELQSTNEELQSTNEELTTSKEEMQSLNEELQTVNIELQNKINDYATASDDMKNLLNSTEIATLFIDKELNIRRYTDEIARIIKLRESDIGRPFTDLVSSLDYPKIGEHAKQVLKTLNSVQTSIKTNDHRWYEIRIMPYRTINDRIDGLVLTFTNITIAKKLEIELLEANAKLKKNIIEEK